MRERFSHEIENDPEPDDAGTITITATILDEYSNLTTTTQSLAKDFFDVDECQSKQELNYFLLEAGINEDDIEDALMNLIGYVESVTCPASTDYSPGCALKVRFDFIPGYLDDDDSLSQIEQVAQASFDHETSNIRTRPASKLVVKSLTRRIYKKKIEKDKANKRISLQECTICLQDFTNGGRVVTLPCGHDFDDECIVKWFETSHVCPLCRFELPCEDQ
ncbi:unnamed protein product [Thlaspi arvense]|uniref:RING-type domain-containing protein n=1 Tax=Thlaspi arvense TaxID=13288 RepID=A0AAU9RBS8_THLAR|nr:unnamed protein product [Thlaspi arvense]